MTRERVRELLEAGHSVAETARRLGVSPPTVCYHARKLGRPAAPVRRYDWTAVQSFHDAGAGFAECQERFGFSKAAWHDAVKRGELAPRSPVTPLSEFLVAGRRVHRPHIKKRLVAEGLKVNACELCDLSSWQGRPLTLELHHVNGDPVDNRLENLQLLCPNCHSQTDTYAGRNARAARPHQRP